MTNRVTGAVHTPVTTTVYDVDGLGISETVADSTGGDAARTESRTYNSHGLAETSTDAAGKTTRLEYDAYGNQTKEFDSDGGEVDSTYDAEGRLLTETLVGYTGDPNNPGAPTNLVTASYAYDPAGRLASETDAMGWVTSYTYTDNGLQATITRRDPVSGASFVQESNAYDAAGNLLSQTTNNGTTTTTFAVDAANRTTASTLDPAGLNRVSSFEYSTDDQQVAETVSGSAGVLSRSETMYDPAGRAVAHTVLNGTTAPVARWKLNDTSGLTATDSAGNSPATGTSGVTWSSAHGGSAIFDGTGGRLTTTAPALDSARGFTVSAWVNLADNTRTHTVASATGRRQSPFELRFDASNHWQFVVRQADADSAAATAVTSTAAPALNTWTQLTGVYDPAAGTLKLYVNGASPASATAPKTFTGVGPFQIGSDLTNGTVGNLWQGSLSDVQLYSRPLTSTEVSSVYQGTAPAAGAGAIRTSQLVDQDGLATAVVDPNGNVTNYDYDEAGQAVVTVAPAVLTETNGGAPVATRAVSYTGYDTFGEQTESKDPNGNVTVTAYDAAGRPTSTTLPSYTPPGTSTPISPVSTIAYDTLGQVTSQTDPLGKITRYTYDQLGRVAKVTTPDLAATTFTYDALGDRLTSTDPTGAVHASTYDYLGHQLTTTDVVRQDGTSYTTHYSYHPSGWVSAVQSPSGVTSSTTYDAAGEPVTLTDAAGNISTTAYDGLGRVVRNTAPDGTYTTTTYDMAGRAVATKAYDSNNVLLSTRTSAYDNANQVVAATDARAPRRRSATTRPVCSPR
ncbi:LamG-like jellyroll fold domain-containing protein [Plantactinospora sp. KBS50]|uniref:LamG-like jellyroll fold domain-containing protein n=1 Tax=Plantactinospora sp. KBS50 TaxID=2024580 RepID=UPI0018DF297E|nr:LamG-like jellyroll fold domain-containing protein [Plantactinospora sp. KBS50]